jgi:hypothetical protein
MHLSKGDYTQFSQKGRLRLLYEFGHLLNEKSIKGVRLQLFLLYDFHVVVYCKNKNVITVEPIVSDGYIRFLSC